MSTVNCANCGAENPTHVNFCRQCGSKLKNEEQAADPPIAATTTAPIKEQPVYARSGTLTTPTQARQSDAEKEKRYGALRGIATMCQALAIASAIIIVLLGVILFFVLLSESFSMAISTVTGALLSAAIVYIVWRIIGESISVLLDIEENTRQTAFLLQNRQ
jgi:uncharacterized membrane protein YvbJ